MNIQQFNHLINSTNQPIEADDTKQLENLVTTFPYCQTGHLLLCKAAKEQGNMMSEMRVKTASAYSVNRRYLKRFLLEKVNYVSSREDKKEVAIKIIETKEEVGHVDQYSTGETEESIEPEILENEVANVSAEIVVDSVVVEPHLKSGSVLKNVNGNYDKDGVIQVEKLSIAEEIHKSLEELRRLKEDSQVEISKKESDLIASDKSNANTKEIITEELSQRNELQQEVQETIENTIVNPQIVEQKKLSVKIELVSKIVVDNKKSEAKPSVNIKEKLKALSKKVKAEGEQKTKRAKKKQGEISHHKPDEDLFDSKLGESGGEKENSEADLILKYLESLDKKKNRKALKRSQSVILEKFIKNEPKISRIKINRTSDQEKQEDFSKQSGTLKLKVVNENMARIYAKQGNNGKAIKIYKALMLKKPEKKLYFAIQIEKLKKQQ